MSVPNFHLCDVCGDETNPKSQIFAATGESRDASGNSWDLDGRPLDLCGPCAMAVLKALQESARRGSLCRPVSDRYFLGVAILQFVDKWAKEHGKS
jgi:hypothetical protein